MAASHTTSALRVRHSLKRLLRTQILSPQNQYFNDFNAYTNHFSPPKQRNSVRHAFRSMQLTQLTQPMPPVRTYFTNTDQIKKSNPFTALNLEWGATATEIKEAYHRLARELHPDVSNLDPAEALEKFRVVKNAYDTLMNKNGKNGGIASHRTDLMEEWSFAIWRSSDLIAQERTDVAGLMRKRPVKPADAMKKKGWGVAALGHPDGRGNGGSLGRRGEYLGTGGARSSTVGTGRNKWVQKKEFRPWNPEDVKLKCVSDLRSGRK